MANYGTNIGKGNSFGDSTSITNTTNINKNRTTVSIAIGVVVIIAIVALFILVMPKEINISGIWTTSSGDTIEFLSDGTIHENGYDSLNPDTYEITEEGYLKWGKYDASWIQYKYTYWDIELNGNHMKLTMRSNPDYTIELTK